MLENTDCVTGNMLPNLELVIEFIRKNLFRPLVNTKLPMNITAIDTGNTEEEKDDPAWPFLHVGFT